MCLTVLHVALIACPFLATSLNTPSSSSQTEDIEFLHPISIVNSFQDVNLISPLICLVAPAAVALLVRLSAL